MFDENIKHSVWHSSSRCCGNWIYFRSVTPIYVIKVINPLRDGIPYNHFFMIDILLSVTRNISTRFSSIYCLILYMTISKCVGVTWTGCYSSNQGRKQEREKERVSKRQTERKELYNNR